MHEKQFSNRRYCTDHPNVEGFIVGFLVFWATFALCNPQHWDDLCNIFDLKIFVPLPLFVIFAAKLKRSSRTLMPGPRWPPEEGSAKVPPELGPGRRCFCTPLFGGGQWKTVQNLVFNFAAKITDKRFLIRRYCKDHPNVAKWEFQIEDIHYMYI